MITTWSDLDWGRESGVKPGTHSQSEASQTSLTTRLARGCKRWYPLAPGRRYGTRKSPLSEYMSLYLSLKLATNCGLLSRIKWDIYFYKDKCFVRSLNFVNHVWEYTTLLHLFHLAHSIVKIDWYTLESWRLEETCCHSDSSERLPVKTHKKSK